MRDFTRKELQERLSSVTDNKLALVSYSPGDGATRYRIVSSESGYLDYFGGRAESRTVLGLEQARIMVESFIVGNLWANANR